MLNFLNSKFFYVIFNKFLRSTLLNSFQNHKSTTSQHTVLPQFFELENCMKLRLIQTGMHHFSHTH